MSVRIAINVRQELRVWWKEGRTRLDIKLLVPEQLNQRTEWCMGNQWKKATAKTRQRKTSDWNTNSINLLSSKTQRKNKQWQMMETGEKQAANSQGMDDTIIPQRLLKTVFLSILEKEMSGWYTYICTHICTHLKYWETEDWKNHTSTTKTL